MLTTIVLLLAAGVLAALGVFQTHRRTTIGLNGSTVLDADASRIGSPTRSATRTTARSQSQTPSLNASSRSLATCIVTGDLPAPPGPVTVSTRAESICAFNFQSSRSRPV